MKDYLAVRRPPFVFMDSSTFFPILVAALLVVVVLALVWWRARRQQQAAASKPRGKQGETLDTLLAWTPEPSRILTSAERQAYMVLRQALPDRMILAQVPLARFLRVPTRNSYNEWMRRVGQLCADLVVCNEHSEVLAVIEVRQPSDREGGRTARRHHRMDRVLQGAGIALHVWNENLLPTPAAARAAIVGSAPVAPLASREGTSHVNTASGGALPTGWQTASAAGRATAPANSAADSLEDVPSHALREPPPSTWFDELETSPAEFDPLERSDKVS